jgi:hypothetical protein
MGCSRLCYGYVQERFADRLLPVLDPSTCSISFQVIDFEIMPEDMAFLDSLDEGLVTDWDPTVDP